VAIVYADSSALTKLVRREPETDALREFVDGSELVSSELVLAEVPRAIQRLATSDRSLPRDALLDRAGELFDSVALCPVDAAVLTAAGAITEPDLRTLDAIHVASALYLGEIDAFLSYDRRQAAVARKAGLSIAAPGA
jgi:predicted nucleic acid-binding protein